MTDQEFKQIMAKLNALESEMGRGDGGCLVVLFFMLLAIIMKIGACH